MQCSGKVIELSAGVFVNASARRIGRSHRGDCRLELDFRRRI